MKNITNRNYDFLIVGAGLFGSVCARELSDMGYKCLVIDSRNHIGGNCYTEKIEGINVHKYGAHIFHTSNDDVWNYVNKFVKFNGYRHHVVANYKNELFSLPFNMFTFNKLWGINNPKDVMLKINEQKFNGEPNNMEEYSLSIVGKEIYEKFIKGYTKKQWMKDPKELPPFIIKRIPVRLTFDNNYFFDKYQGIPVNGYTELFEKLLSGIDVQLNSDFFKNKDFFVNISKKIIYTGQIDKYYNYCFGRLEYRPLKFEHSIMDDDNFQGHTVINYTEESIPYTRIIEHKHFNGDQSNKTIITKEYPIEWQPNSEPYYPINDDENQKIFYKYQKKSKDENNVFFGGRLGEYRYYDMDKVIESALNFIKKINV